MQPNTSPASKSSDPMAQPPNPFMGQLGPEQTATPTEEVSALAGGGKKVVVGQIGRSGTYNFNGIITNEEYNNDLTRWAALKNYDIMRRSDGTVMAALEVVKLPILSATWTVKPASDDPKDIEIADWVRFNLFENNITFADLLSEVMTYLDFGYSVFEKVWDFCDWNGKSMIGLKDLQSRKQRSIYRWETNDTNPVFGITQYVPGGTYSIPGTKLVVFTRKKEGENYEGISILRALYKHWKMKDALELIDAIRHERQGLGIIEIVPPAGANEGDIDDAIENARQARASEEGVIKRPADWTIQWMDMKSGSTQLTDINSSLEYHKREMMKAVLAQFLELGGNKGGSGSKATSADQSSLFEEAEEFTAKYVGSVFNKGVIKELVDINYSKVENYPTVEHSKIGDDSLSEIGTVVNQLMQAGAITPDPQLEQWLRKALHAPELPDDMVDGYADHPSRNKPQIVLPGAPPVPDKKNEDDENSNEESKSAKDTIIRAKQARKGLIDVLLG